MMDDDRRKKYFFVRSVAEMENLESYFKRRNYPAARESLQKAEEFSKKGDIPLPENFDKMQKLVLSL